MMRFNGKNYVKWYSIEQTTPTDNGYYLVCFDNSYPNHSRYRIAQWLHGDWNIAVNDISHIVFWAYLPDLPDGFIEEW